MYRCRVDVVHRCVSNTGTCLIRGVSVFHRSLVMISVALTLLIEGVSRCPTCVCPTPILAITLNYVIFSKFYQCQRVRVCVCASVHH